MVSYYYRHYYKSSLMMAIVLMISGQFLFDNNGVNCYHISENVDSNNVNVADTWERPGCHKVGHTRRISIDDCVEFHITTNACRGYCESWSVPSGLDTLLTNPRQAITSVGECCNIMESEDVEVSVLCLDGTRDLVFKSARSCSCYHCKKD